MNIPHGTIAERGVYVEPYTQEELEASQDVREFVTILGCGADGCKYDWFTETMKFINGEPYSDLTYDAQSDYWFCPSHWAGLHTYEPPRLTPYGDLRELQGRGLG
jgi:hypothetical protein